MRCPSGLTSAPSEGHRPSALKCKTSSSGFGKLPKWRIMEIRHSILSIQGGDLVSTWHPIRTQGTLALRKTHRTPERCQTVPPCDLYGLRIHQAPAFAFLRSAAPLFRVFDWVLSEPGAVVSPQLVPIARGPRSGLPRAHGHSSMCNWWICQPRHYVLPTALHICTALAAALSLCLAFRRKVPNCTIAMGRAEHWPIALRLPWHSAPSI